MADLQQPSQADALEAQQTLLESSLKLVFSAFDVARNDGVADPVIILLDCEDDVGAQIARSWLGREAIAEAIADRRGEQCVDEDDTTTTTVFAHAFAWRECADAVPKVFPYLAPVFNERLSDDGFLAIAVTCGGASAMTVPLSAREPT